MVEFEEDREELERERRRRFQEKFQRAQAIARLKKEIETQLFPKPILDTFQLLSMLEGMILE